MGIPKNENPLVFVIESHRAKMERRQYKQWINKRVNKNQLIIKDCGLLHHRGTKRPSHESGCVIPTESTCILSHALM